MAVLLLFMGSIGLGFLLILLIAVTAPRPPPVDLKRESGGSVLVELSSDQLGDLAAKLLDKMGLEIERMQGGGQETLEIFAVNPAPVTGGKVLIHCIPAPTDTGKVDGRMVGKFIRSVRSAYVSKGLLFTSGTFSADARLEAEDAPVELFDRVQIQKMLDRYFEGGDPASIFADAPT